MSDDRFEPKPASRAAYFALALAGNAIAFTIICWKVSAAIGWMFER